MTRVGIHGEYDGRITVRLLNDATKNEATRCPSDESTIRIVMDTADSVALPRFRRCEFDRPATLFGF